ncbi:hypothetical protein [Limnoglobus roseus]|uniref:Uncharacterized protein n=1 Tax=Limnoglobus roseus TaxID=2598579 RepID=A0A5C1AK02_9BACT|nr:hypothetical protein [Limnoglobus roseus]QEL19005.1 hypothetical protein PX52LOC_06055 [Limnoglobus roseus]
MARPPASATKLASRMACVAACVAGGVWLGEGVKGRGGLLIWCGGGMIGSGLLLEYLWHRSDRKTLDGPPPSGEDDLSRT